LGIETTDLFLSMQDSQLVDPDRWSPTSLLATKIYIPSADVAMADSLANSNRSFEPRYDWRSKQQCCLGGFATNASRSYFDSSSRNNGSLICELVMSERYQVFGWIGRTWDFVFISVHPRKKQSAVPCAQRRPNYMLGVGTS
jgi:hypothetical protein